MRYSESRPSPKRAAFRLAVASTPASTDDPGDDVRPALTLPHRDVPGDRRREQRAAVDRPRQVDPHGVGNGREDVGRVRAPTVDPTLGAARVLHEERYRCDVCHVLRCHVPTRPCRDEARPVIRGDDDERVVVETDLLESLHELGHQPVGVANLENVTLQRLIHEPLRRAPVVESVVEDPVDRCRMSVLATRWQEAERGVRKLDVREVERPRGTTSLDAREKRREPGSGLVIFPLERDVDVVDVERAAQPVARPSTLAEPAPAIADRRELHPQLSR